MPGIMLAYMATKHPAVTMRLPRLLTRYLLREFATGFGLVFAVLTLLAFFQQVTRNLDFVISPHANWQSILHIVRALLPGIIVFTIPIALLVGVTLVLSRLSADHEWTTLLASRVSLYQLQFPLAILTLAAMGIVFYSLSQLVPQSVNQLRALRNEVNLQEATKIIRPGQFITNFPNHLLRINAVNLTQGTWQGVLVIKQDPASKTLQILAARQGILSQTPQVALSASADQPNPLELKLSNGVSLDNLLRPTAYTVTSFQEYIVKLENISLAAARESISPQTFNPKAEMGKQAATLTSAAIWRALKLPSLNSKERREGWAELLRRCMLTLACLFASLTAWRLQLYQPSQSRKSKGLPKLGLGLLACVAYYLLLNTTHQAALTKTIPLWALYLGLFASSSILIAILPYLTHWLIISDTSRPPTAQLKNSLELPIIGRRSPNRLGFIKLVQFSLTRFLLLSEGLKHFLVIAAILLLTILLFTALDISSAAAKNGIRPAYTFGYLALLAPQIIYYFAPFALFLAVIFTAMVLARSGQLKVLVYYSSSLLDLLLPFLGLAIVIGATMYLAAERVLPYTNRAQDLRFRYIKGRNIDDISIATAFQMRWYSDTARQAVYGLEILGQNTLPTPPAISSTPPHVNLLAIQFADSPYYLKEVRYLPDLSLVNQTALQPRQGIAYTVFDTGQVQLTHLDATQAPLNTTLFFKPTPSEASKMTRRELATQMKLIENSGWSARPLKMEHTQRVAFPVACLSLILLAFPFLLYQIKRHQHAGLQAVGFSLVLALSFWGLMSIFETAGKVGLIPIDLAAWAPHALCLSLAFALQAKLNTH